MDWGIFMFYKIILLGYFVFDYPIPGIRLYCKLKAYHLVAILLIGPKFFPKTQVLNI